jgi:membrane protease YdiL (CAAX protease family)
MLSRAVGFLFVLLLVAGVPALSLLTVQRSRTLFISRPVLYLSASVSQWLLAVLGALTLHATSLRFSQIGFRFPPSTALLRWTIGLTLMSLAVLCFFLLLERLGWWPIESELLYRLLPHTRRERILCVLLLAPTAAFCEEFLYRGYLLTQLTHWLNSAAWGLGTSSVAFGFAHLYQGFGGMLRAALFGALLAYPVISAGSLYPSMATHFVIDAVALAWLGPRFLPRTPQP